MELLTTNAKLVKGDGIPCFGVSLAPADLSGYNMCPMASEPEHDDNRELCEEFLRDDGIVSVPFRTMKSEKLPKRWLDWPVDDGDTHDRLFLRKPGTVLGLRYKGPRDRMDKGCKQFCLQSAGRGRFNTVPIARIKRTIMLVEEKEDFLAQLCVEIEDKQRLHGKIAVRPNTLSDQPWETSAFHVDGKSLFEWYPDVAFYDYTKIPKRMRKYLRGEMPPNYTLVFSFNKVWKEAA